MLFIYLFFISSIIFIMLFLNYWLGNPFSLKGLELYQGNDSIEKFLFYFQDLEVKITFSLWVIYLLLLIFVGFKNKVKGNFVE